MPYLDPVGKPEAPIWVILEKPFASDAAKQKLLSGGMGYAFQKMFSEAGLRLGDIYFVARRPDTENPLAASSIENLAAVSKPPLLLLVGEAAGFFLPELKALPGQETHRSQLNKYVGSLLSAPSFSWPHYAMPLHSPETLMQDWAERNVTTYIDLGKVREELEYYRAKGSLQPLRERTLLFTELKDDEVLKELDTLRTASSLSVDLETVYTRADSAYKTEYPGGILVIGIAPSPDKALSFNPFRASPAATCEVWRTLDKLLRDCQLIIGQNFFNFDSFYFNMYGFSLDKNKFSDTLLRAHILWPELPRKLQFLTRQYTRCPYYKDEMQRTSLKKMDALRHYNCLDAAVTFEVWEQQEKEFDLRPHLR